MKIRQGFVSNSSSSSFVVKGFVPPVEVLKGVDFEKLYTKYGFDKTKFDPEMYNDEEVKREFINFCFRDKGIFFADSIDDGAPDGYVIFGKKLYCNEDCYLPSLILDTSSTPLLEQIKEDFELQDFDIKIICGSRCC